LWRWREAASATGASIIVSKRNTKEVRELAQLMRSLGAEKFMQLYPLPGLGEGPIADDSILELEDVLGLPPQGLDVEWGQEDFWADPAAFTEGALTRAAMQAKGAEETPPEARQRSLWLRITADFEVLAPEARERADALRVANLRDDSPSEVYERLAGIPWPPDPPSDQELARRYGDTASRKLHSLWSVRRKWLKEWRIQNGIRWLPLECYE
jgi:hypothetical protein